MARRDLAMRVCASPPRGPQPAGARWARLPPPLPGAAARFEGANRVLCPPLNSNSLATLKWNKVDEVRFPGSGAGSDSGGGGSA